MHLDRPGVSAARAACLVTSPLIHPWLCFSIRDASLQQPLCTCSNRKNRLPATAPIFLCFLYFLSGSFARHSHSGSFRISLLLKHPSHCVLKQAFSHRAAGETQGEDTHSACSGSAPSHWNGTPPAVCVCLNCRPVAKSQPFSRLNPCPMRITIRFDPWRL
jgi:hypothetical protein